MSELGSELDRQLWEPAVQARDPEQVARLAREGLQREWDRVWQLPVPYYRELYRSAALQPGDLPPLDEIPRTDKPTLRLDEAAHPPFGTHRVIGLEQAVRLGSSTGTTGTPTMIFYGPNDFEVAIDIGIRNMWRHGVRAGDRFTHSWPQGIYPTNVTGGRSYLAVGALEISVGPPFTPDVAAEHLRTWQLLRPTAFMMTAAQLRTYEEAATAHGVDLPALLDGAILVFLEASCQFEGPRRRVESAYGVRIRNTGGASEIPGLATTDCTAHQGLHVAGDHFVVQACDPVTGREVADGDRGTLVVSAFGLDALFLRYDLQDIVTVDRGTCACGETGPRYTLLGRGADAAHIDGRVLLPLDVQLALEDLGAPELQLVPDVSMLRVRVEADDRQRGRLAGAIREALQVRVEVETVAAGSLPRSSFKPRRVAT
jgi:phenylacetate-CoA ligase